MEIESARVLGGNGWSELHLSDGKARLIVKVEERDGRGYVTRLLVAGDELDWATLKAIPIARIESWINHPRLGFPAGLAKRLDQATLDELDEKGTDKLDEAITGLLAREVIHSPELKAKRAPRPPLTRPDGTDTDAYYRRVAEAYSAATLQTPRPARALADEAGVPLTTVHRWVAEARRRGFLPRAHKGRAG